ncbi:MAG: hypothetical protein ABSE56_02555 [Bryobacteraceae bacterium]|jgi:hypothetical protein
MTTTACILSAAVFVAAALLAFQSRRAEDFDTSGMPRRPTNFIEQQISEMIASRTWGDLEDAARIQRKLGRYYADRGDGRRSTAAFLAAAAAEQPAKKQADQALPPQAVPGQPPAPAPPTRPSLTGNYFGYEGRTLHTWDFNINGTYLHTWIAAGAGASVRNSERGAFAVFGDELELRPASAAGGFVTPGAGGRSTVVGGGEDSGSPRRRLKFVRSENGILLDGMKLKPKSW